MRPALSLPKGAYEDVGGEVTMDVGSGKLLQEIKFDYLPEESPTEHGWALRKGSEEDLLSHEDPVYGYILRIKAEQDLCLDYDLVGKSKQECKAVEFVVRSESKFSFHAIVRVRSQRQGKTPSEVRLRYDFNSDTEVRYPKPHPNYLNEDKVEYRVYAPVDQLKHGWTLMKIDLPKKVREIAAFEDKEWEFSELLTLRLKGDGVDIDVARIRLYSEYLNNVSTLPPGPIRNRWALLVGVNQYVDPAFPPLKFCVNDVLALERTLKALGYTVVALHDDTPEERLLPTRDNVEAELTRLCQVAGPDDLLLVHFACHGKLVSGQPVLITRETRAPTLAKKALPLAEAERLMRESQVRRLVLTLDACHAGVEIGRDLADPEFIHNAYELAEGFALIAASTAQQVAQEWEKKEHGVFTYYLLEGLSSQADRAGKGFVTVDDLKTHVLDGLRRWNVEHGGLLQEPTARTEGLGDIILADYRDRARPVVRPPISITKEQTTTGKALPHFMQSLEDYLHKDWEGLPEPFRLQPIPRWIDYQTGLIPPSPAVEQVLKALERARFVVLSGPMGSGKSTTARHVGFRLATEQNWTVSIVLDVREFAVLWEDQQTWQALKNLDKDDSLVVIDDIHLAPEDVGKFVQSAQQEFSHLKFLLVGRPPPKLPGRRHRAALELISLPTVECHISHELIAALIQMRLTQLQLARSRDTTPEEFADQCGGDLFILTRLLRYWDGGDLPLLASVAEHFQADLRSLLADEALGIDGVTTMFVVGCLHEVEIETPVELLTETLGIPWQVVNTLVGRQELIEAGPRLKLNHASQACLVREAIEQGAVLKSAVKSAVTGQISEELAPLELRLVPLLAHMLRDPKATTRVCFQLTTIDGRETDWLELWRQPVLERLIMAALESEASYFFMGWGLYGIGDAIYEVDPPDAHEQTQRLVDFVRSLEPVLAPKLGNASADDVIDFLMMPMIWSSLIDPLLEILASIEVKEHVNKLVETVDAGTIGLYLGYIFSSPASAELGSKIVIESLDHLLNVIASSESAEGVGRLIYAVGHSNANLAARLLGKVQASIKADACAVVLQLIHDDEQWDDPEALQAASLIFGKGDAPHQLLSVMEHLVELEPEDVWVRTMYGRSLAQSERFADAEHELRAALAVRGDYVLALESLLTLLLSSGRREEAQEIFNRLGEADPERTSVAWEWLDGVVGE